MQIFSFTFFTLLLTSNFALAQTPVGVWNCESISNRQLPNQPPNNLMTNMTLQLNPNGAAYAQGTETAQLGQFGFQAEAQWSVNGNQLIISGYKQGGSAAAFFTSNGMPVPPEATQFVFSTLIQSDQFMAWEGIQGNEQVGISRFANQCQLMQ